MKTTHLRNLLLAVVCLFAGVSAHAQFQGSAEQYPTADWSAAPIEFSLSEVASALSTDAATLGAAISEYVQAETPATILFSANGTQWAAELEASNHGFWMAADGTPVGYGDASVWYCSPQVDEAFTTLTFNVGQMPNVMQVGDKGQTTIALKFNDKEVSFALTLSVIAKPVYEIPAPTVIEKDLTIVGEQEKVVEQYPRGGYDSDAIGINLAEALTALGISDKAMVAEALENLLFATVYNAGAIEEGGGMKKDSLSNVPTAGGIGWWLRPVQNAEGVETGECSAFNWGDADRFFIEAFAFNAETDTLTCNLGQYPGTCKDNEQYFTYIYLIYGDKAYRIKYTLKVMEKEQGSGLSDYTKVGEESVTVTQEPLSSWGSVAVRPDLDAIAAALECEVSALGLVALDDKDNFGASTANNGGWWLSQAGMVVAYPGDFYIEPATANDYSVLNVGQMINKFAVGDEMSASLYFINGTKYYQYNVTLQIVAPEYVDFGFESVETRNFSLQAIPANAYEIGDLVTINAESLEAAIGTTAPTLYGLNIDSVATERGIYSNAYSCDPKPGFWLNKDGRVSAWGDANLFVGICWVDNSTLRFFQIPNSPAVGDVFKTQLFLVNEETEKMITLNITLNFVESLEQKEVVGQENIALALSDEDEVPLVIDLTKPAEALGTTVDDLLSPNSYYLRGLKSDGVYGETKNCENGLSFAADGGFDDHGNIYFYIEKQGDVVMLKSFSNDPVAADYSVDIQFCFEKDNKQYVYYGKLMSESLYAGIELVGADAKKQGRIFDLSGRTVKNPVRGLYIQDGRKMIVK